MSFLLHPDAEEEFLKAIEYYEDIERALGYDFALEVYSAIKRSVDYPDAWALMDGDVRRTLVRRFPYAVLYSMEENGIFILAVMNLHRSPEYWKERTVGPK
jgi:hypothetical protein